jgi:protease-4
MLQFLKQAFASTIGTIVGLLIFFATGSGLLFLILLAASQTEETSVPDRSVLVFDLSMDIEDTKAPSTFSEVFAEEKNKTITLRQVLDSIDKATQDKRIVGIFLDGRNASSSSGYANLKEVRSALERFRAAGKKIVAYDVDSSEREYYLASVADSIVLNPMGTMEINGLSSEQAFLTGALNKFGIGIQIIRVGSYKSAVEPLIRQDFSPENRQQTQALLGDLWGEVLQAAAKSRNLTVPKLQEIVDRQGFLTSQQALQSSLIDRVGYFDEVLDGLKELTGSSENDRSFEQISLESYANAEVPHTEKSAYNHKIALVYAEGSIVTGEGGLEQIGGDRLAKELRKLRQDKDVKAIVLRIDSPGGSATASDIILRELELIRQEKPVIVSMGNVAASGGYWIAIGSDYIFAQSNTITGSIGVFGILPNFQEIANNNGVTWDAVKTGPLANLNTNARPKTEAELAIYQRLVQQVYDLFLEKVAKSRKLPLAKVAAIAQGRVWSGEDAQKIGLVDRLGGLNEAVEYAAEKAQLGTDWELEEYPKQRSFEAEIVEKLLNISQVDRVKQVDPLTSQFLKFKKDLAVWQTLNDPKGIYLRLPFNLDIE